MAIKKGDRLIWNDHGRKRLVEATHNECDGNVFVKGENLPENQVSVHDVQPADDGDKDRP